MDYKKVKTLIIGTAKSKAGKEEYYISERLKMWGVMFIAGFTDKYYKPREHKLFTNKYKVGFYDIVEVTEAKDKELKIDLRKNEELSLIYKGVVNFFINITKEYPNLTNIGFNGKTIASWIIEYNDTGKISVSSKYLRTNYTKKFKLKSDLYKHIFKLTINDKEIFATVLPNTSGRISNFDEEPWIKFWKSI